MELAEAIYVITREYPETEKYNMTAQLRRCAVSIPSNIAEGYGRHTVKDYIRFLRIASGSNAELQTQLLLSEKLQLCHPAQITPAWSLSEEVAKMLNSLIRKYLPMND